MHRPDSARTAQKRPSAQEGLLRGWLRRRVGGFAWGGLPLESLFLRHKPFHFLARIGDDLDALLNQLLQPFFIFRARFLKLFAQTIEIFLLGVDIAFFPGDHSIRILERLGVGQQRSRRRTYWLGGRGLLRVRSLLGGSFVLCLFFFEVHIGRRVQ